MRLVESENQITSVEIEMSERLSKKAQALKFIDPEVASQCFENAYEIFIEETKRSDEYKREVKVELTEFMRTPLDY